MCGGPELIFQDDPEKADPRFQDASTRRKFIRKVYSILSLQLAATMAIIACFVYIDEIKEYLNAEKSPWVLYIAMGVQIGVMIALSCCEKPRRLFPLNIILLSVYTLVQGLFLGILSIYLTKDEILVSVGITAVIFFVLTIFAMQSRFDFTTMWVLPLVLGVVLLGLGIAAWLTNIKWLHLAYCGFGIVAFSVYILIDTQMMIGGKARKLTISPEDYIYCCLSLYIDVTTMLMYVMSIMRGVRE
ncbi:hypothetical protein ACFFRR_008211 [Megaselia abdita]